MPAVESAAPGLLVSGVVDEPEFADPEGAAFCAPELLEAAVVSDPVCVGVHGFAAVPAGGVAGVVEGVAVLPEVELPFVMSLLPLVLGWPFC